MADKNSFSRGAGTGSFQEYFSVDAVFAHGIILFGSLLFFYDRILVIGNSQYNTLFVASRLEGNKFFK